jgi:hypothetical protein
MLAPMTRDEDDAAAAELAWQVRRAARDARVRAEAIAARTFELLTDSAIARGRSEVRRHERVVS